MEELYIDFDKIPDGETVANILNLKEITGDRRILSELADQWRNHNEQNKEEK